MPQDALDQNSVHLRPSLRHGSGIELVGFGDDLIYLPTTEMFCMSLEIFSCKCSLGTFVWVPLVLGDAWRLAWSELCRTARTRERFKVIRPYPVSLLIGIFLHEDSQVA